MILVIQVSNINLTEYIRCPGPSPGLHLGVQGGLPDDPSPGGVDSRPPGTPVLVRYLNGGVISGKYFI